MRLDGLEQGPNEPKRKGVRMSIAERLHMLGST